MWMGAGAVVQPLVRLIFFYSVCCAECSWQLRLELVMLMFGYYFFIRLFVYDPPLLCLVGESIGR